MKRRRLWIAGGVILALALLLAFPLRDVLNRTVITPAAYLLWVLGLFYRSMPQLVWWGLAILIAMLLVVASLSPGERFVRKKMLPRIPINGQVESLAQSIDKAREGIYFRWIVANRLGKLAHKILAQREGNPDRSVFAPLLGSDWQPSADLRTYLETGLHGSFSDYPVLEGGRRSNSATPLDLDIEEAVAFLESRLEAVRDRHR